MSDLGLDECPARVPEVMLQGFMEVAETRRVCKREKLPAPPHGGGEAQLNLQLSPPNLKVLTGPRGSALER